MELDANQITWIEEVTGGKIASIEHQVRWRPHFFVDVIEPDGNRLELLVRLERDPEIVPLSVFLSRFDLEHESRVLDALQATTVKVPRYFSFHAESKAILMERVGGTTEFADIDDADQGPLLLEYLDNLHRLHSVEIDEDVAAMLGGPAPATPDELAFGLIGHLEQDYRNAQAFMRPEPLIEFGLWWLHNNVPQHRTEAHWVQGDTGPGQFMGEGASLTALIDWELSHLGDPLLDLGVMRMRNMLYPVGDLASLFDRYEELSGEPIDQETLIFYTVLSTVLTPMGLAVSIQNPDPASDSTMPRFGWDVTLRRGLCDALCEAYGVEVEEPSLDVPDGGEEERTNLNRFLVDYLTAQCAPIATTDHETAIIGGAIGVAEALDLAVTAGPHFEAQDLDDMGQVLGERPADREAGLVALAELVATNPEDAALDLLWLFSRMERRHEVLWRPLMVAQESEPLERIYPAERTISAPGHRHGA